MKTRVLLAVTLLAGFAASAQAASIVNSKHDLSSGIASATSIHSTTQNQTCVFCHAPHNAQTNKLLWNRTNTPSGATMRIYTSYNTGAMRTALTQSALGDDSSSLLCLSCHAISTANITQVITFSVGGGTAGAGTGAWSARTGNMTDLRNDHPVGINYQSAQTVATATGLVAPTGGTVVNGARTLRLFKSAVSATQTMECATCHTVHDPANGKFLAINNAQSNLCTTCHVK